MECSGGEVLRFDIRVKKDHLLIAGGFFTSDLALLKKIYLDDLISPVDCMENVDTEYKSWPDI